MMSALPNRTPENNPAAALPPADSHVLSEARLPAGSLENDSAGNVCPELSRSSRIYCLWRHVDTQVPDLESRLLSACKDRKVDCVHVLHEAVGGKPYDRRKLESEINRNINASSGPAWKAKLWCAEVIAGMASFFSRGGSVSMELSGLVAQLREVEMFRRLRRNLGVEIKYSFIDLHEFHPSYQNVREEDRMEKHFFAGLLGALPAGAGDRHAVIENLMGRLKASTEVSAETLRIRNANLRQDVERISNKAGPRDLQVVVTGLAHIAISRGLEGYMGELLFSSFHPEVALRRPALFKNTYNYSFGAMKLMKLADGMTLSESEYERLLIFKVLMAKFADELGAANRFQTRTTRGLKTECAAYLATDLILNLTDARALELFESCKKSLEGWKKPEDSVLIAFGEPLGRVAADLLRDGSNFRLSRFGRNILELARTFK